MAADGRGGVEPIEILLAPPGPGELLLRVDACGLCGTDLYKLDTRSVPRGTVLGHELVGTVVARGEGTATDVGARLAVPHHVSCGRCDLCRAGSETMCSEYEVSQLDPGGFSDHVLVRRAAVEHTAREAPAGLSDEAALFLEPTACVVRSLDRAGLDRWPSTAAVAVLGAGAMGLLHLLVLRARFPERPVVVIEPRDDRRRAALERGATAAVEPGEEWPLGAERARVVFDTVGGEAALDTALRHSSRGSTILLFAHPPPGERSRIDLHALFRRERTVATSYSGGRADQEAAWQLLRSGALDAGSLVSHTLALSELAQGLELVRSREALKLVLRPTDSTAPDPTGGTTR